MTGSSVRRGGRGFSIVEMLAVMAVIAVLFSLGVTVYRGARQAARVATAENNLKQVSAAMELYFRKYGAYPPQGSDLVQELSPFVQNIGVFTNPLKEESKPGATLTTLYAQPDTTTVDTPGNYVTAFVSDDGHTAVILETCAQVESRRDLDYNPDSLTDAFTVLTEGHNAPLPPPPGDDGDTGGGGSEPGFDVDEGDGGTVVRLCSDVYINALGSQFGYADGTLVDIVTAARLDTGNWFALFGNQPIVGGESLKLESIPAGTKVVIRGEIYDPYTRWLWTKYGYPLSYTSTDNTGQVVTLRNGDEPICNKPGYPYQVGVRGLLAPCVDPATGLIKIADNQALYCFDFNPLRTGKGIDFNDLVILATATVAELSCDENQPGVPGDQVQPDPVIAGQLNLNPNNKMDFEFEMTLPGGSKITRDDLLRDRKITYLGPCDVIRVRPKGNGNQNTITLDGNVYRVYNGSTYLIERSPGGYMTAYLYNSNTQGMGKWWIVISATGASIRKL